VRITREKLIQLAEQEIHRRVTAGDPILSGYLIGSTALAEPLLGGAADIDLVLIHAQAPPRPAEIVPLSPDVHLDITHHTAEFYNEPTQLRVDPWWGPALSEPVFLFDPQHFFERAQAGARGQFHRPDHALARAQAFLTQARRDQARLEDASNWPQGYLRAALEGANAAACLAGPPAAGRRLTLALERNTTALGSPEVYSAFLRLLNAEAMTTWQLPEVLSSWGHAMDAAAARSGQDGWFQPVRRRYHLAGFQALVEAGHPQAILWPLLETWDQAIRSLPQDASHAVYRSAWEGLLAQMSLLPTASGLRLDELEAFLDHVELILEKWAHDNGA